MDVARDLLDHQLRDSDGAGIGRIDDLELVWDGDGSRLGPILTGGEIVLDRLGWLGGRLRRPLGRFLERTSFDWSEVRRVESTAVTLALGQEGVSARRRAGARSGEEAATIRYGRFMRLPVVDPEGRRWRVLDVRVSLPEPGAAPQVLGAIVDSGNPLHRMGLKRSDTVSLPLVPLGRDTRFASVDALAVEEARLVARRPFSELALLVDAPDPGPPPTRVEGGQ